MVGPNSTLRDCYMAIDCLEKIFREAITQGGVEFDASLSKLIAVGLEDVLTCLKRIEPSVRPQRVVADDINEIERRLEQLRQPVQVHVNCDDQEAVQKVMPSLMAMATAATDQFRNVINFSEAALIAKRYRESDALDRRNPA